MLRIFNLCNYMHYNKIQRASNFTFTGFLVLDNVLNRERELFLDEFNRAKKIK